MVNINQNIMLQNFSRLLGLPDSEKRITFEMFARELSQRLELGDQLFVKPLGYFSIKRLNLDYEQDQPAQNVLLFSEKEISSQSADIIFFLMPEEQSPGSLNSDSYLNLSIDKPLVSVLENELDFNSLPSGKELVSLIESKIDKLFYEYEIIRKSSPKEEEYSPQKFENIPSKTHIEKIKTDDKDLGAASVDDLSLAGDSANDKAGYESVEPIDFINEEKLKAELMFDDFAIQKEIESHDDNVEIKEILSETGYDKKDIPSESNFQELKLLPRKKKKRKSRQLIYIILGITLTAIVSFISYLKYDEISKFISKLFTEENKTDLTINKIEPTIIDRTISNQWVISYPRVEKNIDPPNDSLIIAPSIFMKDKVEEVPSPPDTISNSMISGNIPELQMVADNIYKLGDEYIVQVSSWKSKAKAEKESKKVQLKDHPVNVIEYNSPSLGTVYRVRVGGFKSFNEANKFLTLNK